MCSRQTVTFQIPNQKATRVHYIVDIIALDCILLAEQSHSQCYFFTPLRVRVSFCKMNRLGEMNQLIQIIQRLGSELGFYRLICPQFAVSDKQNCINSMGNQYYYLLIFQATVFFIPLEKIGRSFRMSLVTQPPLKHPHEKETGLFCIVIFC